MERRYLLPGIIILMAFWLSFPSCKHDPVLPGDDLLPIDTLQLDTTSFGTPCDSDVVYFDMEVLPILISNCALSGCHDEASAQDDVVLTSFEKVMQTGKVKAFDLNGSDIYEVLVEDDPDKRMPPPPTAALNQDMINLIAKWILQGAADLECDENAGGCNTENVSFSGFVQPTIQTNCQGCHSGNTPSGGVDLSSFDNIRTYAISGKLYGAISWDGGFPNMPQGGAKLPDCTIEKIKSWIDEGALNN